MAKVSKGIPKSRLGLSGGCCLYRQTIKRERSEGWSRSINRTAEGPAQRRPVLQDFEPQPNLIVAFHGEILPIRKDTDDEKVKTRRYQPPTAIALAYYKDAHPARLRELGDS